MKKNINKTIYFLLGFIFVAFIFFFLTKEKSFDLPENNKIDFKNLKKIENVGGQVLSPLDFSGVSGLSLSLANTSIITNDGGTYFFTGFGEDNKIKMNHPKISRTVEKIIEEESMNIYFDVSLYNELIAIVNMEARGQIESIYNKLDQKVRENVALIDFSQNYRAIFEKDNISDQSLLLKSIKIKDAWKSESGIIIDKVYEIEVLNRDQAKKYNFTNSGNWYLAI